MELPSLLESEPLRDWERRYPGRKAIGYLCTYVPEEIAHAAGLTPVRLLPCGGPISLADASLPSYTCSLARSTLEQALQGRLAFLQGVLFSHTCDTMQCLADIWRAATGSFVETMVQPVNLVGAHAMPYLVAELRRFARSLEEGPGVRITEEALWESIRLYNRHRELLASLYRQRESLSATQLFSLVRAGMTMPKEEHNRLLEQTLSALAEGNAEGSEEARPRLLISGSTLDDASLLALIEEMGGQVVSDDLCDGSRYFDAPIADGENPWEALALRFLRRAPCPCKYGGLEARGRRVLDLARRHRVDGVLFVFKKFCEPHAWDYPYLADLLRREGIPHLLIETEQGTPVEQFRTRVQAFLEMLTSG